jgi:hypothetical protein
MKQHIFHLRCWCWNVLGKSCFLKPLCNKLV